MATIDDVEAKLIAFATDLGITKGKLEALDRRVEHNCQRNEDNFKLMNKKIDTLSNNVIEAISRGQARDEAVRQEVDNLVKINHDLDKKVIARKVLIACGIGLAVLTFLGGSVISWKKIDQFFERTTMEQRADMVKKSAETIGKISK